MDFIKSRIDSQDGPFFSCDRERRDSEHFYRKGIIESRRLVGY